MTFPQYFSPQRHLQKSLELRWHTREGAEPNWLHLFSLLVDYCKKIAISLPYVQNPFQKRWLDGTPRRNWNGHSTRPGPVNHTLKAQQKCPFKHHKRPLTSRKNKPTIEERQASWNSPHCGVRKQFWNLRICHPRLKTPFWTTSTCSNEIETFVFSPLCIKTCVLKMATLWQNIARGTMDPGYWSYNFLKWTFPDTT